MAKRAKGKHREDRIARERVKWLDRLTTERYQHQLREQAQADRTTELKDQKSNELRAAMQDLQKTMASAKSVDDLDRSTADRFARVSEKEDADKQTLVKAVTDLGVFLGDRIDRSNKMLADKSESDKHAMSAQIATLVSGADTAGGTAAGKNALNVATRANIGTIVVILSVAVAIYMALRH